MTESDVLLTAKREPIEDPFLLIGEIENHIRLLIAGKFNADELKQACDPTDKSRDITDVSDLTFGEYIWLLDKPERWERLDLALDRKIFIDRLTKVRDIRNDVMHFDPDPLEKDQREVLRDCVQFLQTLRQITTK